MGSWHSATWGKSEVISSLSHGVLRGSLDKVLEMLVFGPEKTAFGKHPHLGSLVGVLSVAAPASMTLYQQMSFPFAITNSHVRKALENYSSYRNSFHYVPGAEFSFLFSFSLFFFFLFCFLNKIKAKCCLQLSLLMYIILRLTNTTGKLNPGLN